MNLLLKQSLLSKNVILEDIFEKINTIGAASQISRGNEILSCFVVCSYPDLQLLEKKFAKFKTSFPYVSGLLSFREGPCIILAYKKLEVKPDLILLSAAGICHPRFFGMASHIGLILDKPTIGVTKKLLCGEVREGKIIYRGRHVGWKLKNIYISPGHKISLETSLQVVKECMGSHRLPEPLYISSRCVRDWYERPRKV